MKKLFAIFSRVMKVPEENLSLETSKNELENWDSLAHLQVIAEIEEAFSVSIPFEVIAQLTTIGDFAKYIKE
ncbi:acyl carrier protein [Sporomusaceae bacterium BoRhaA]|uniref:acyl carrier protein n=1 Tax=Pelorhabdus rhamnosifermentans TaxID=2772457 RepID=UPI001C061095|nr:acyl carrier protein [Pelorhabdus rhamnosifermentans]MBU2699193.1 acyl carrier protein [Pelorhabdus rhamnosifermentans]